MGKIEKNFRERSIKKDFAVYLLGYVLGALIVSVSCSGLLQFAQSKVPKEYMFEYVEDGIVHRASKKSLDGKWEQGAELESLGEDPDREEDSESSDEVLHVEKFVDENGNYFYMDYIAPDIVLSFEGFNGVLYEVLGIGSGVVYPVVFAAGIGITSRLFYKRKLQKPLEMLNRAADKISNNDLDFEISCGRQDELGRLCSSFEKMRHALQDNNREMWRQIEERRRLNAAFSHDLRTPLTVLKGQSEMLIKYAPEMSEEKIEGTARMMQRHIARLEHYVDTMGDLQRLEDIDAQRKWVDKRELVKQMRETGRSLCGEKSFRMEEGETDGEAGGTAKEQGGDALVNLDLSIVMQVYENLLANAVRYAERTITVTLSGEKDYFSVTVSDDGKGFSAKDLAEATKPFYKAVEETDHEHFGMGLHICRVLCEKHGGYLELKNAEGASVTAAFGQATG